LYQKIHKYYILQTDRLERCIQKISNGIDDDQTVNLLRTSIKRLKSLFVLASSLSDSSFDKSEIFILKKLFKSAAILRDYQVIRKIIHRKKKQEIYSGFLRFLSSTEISGKNILLTGIKEFNIKELDNIFRSKLLAFENIKTKNFTQPAEKLIIIKIKQLSEKLENCCNENLFHKARIKVKEIVYFREIIDGKPEKKAPLAQMGVKMGRWHDRVVFRQMLENFIKNSEKNDSEILKRISVKSELENNNKLSELKSQLTQIFCLYPKQNENINL
jgi:CHAD domain-containing protein